MALDGSDGEGADGEEDLGRDPEEDEENWAFGGSR